MFHTASLNNALKIVWLPGAGSKGFRKRVLQLHPDAELHEHGDINVKAEQQIREYLDGKRRHFSVALTLQGTSFQKKVLTAVQQIPYGQTRTYGEIAEFVGNPKASRAVGTANARNDLPLFIPCHRVVAANGLGGYGGGLELKRHLLRLEGAILI